MGTTTPDLLNLVVWLRGLAVTHVAMESTGGSGPRRALFKALIWELSSRRCVTRAPGAGLGCGTQRGNPTTLSPVSDAQAPALVLVGPPGAGKSTVGRLLADRIGADFTDVDDLIVARAGRSISEIFITDGEPVFRELEETEVASALAGRNGVLALGGGAVLSERTRALLRGQRVVFLSVGMAQGVRRTGLSTARPLLAGVNPRATFAALLDARLPLYREVATVEVATDGRSPHEVAEDVLAGIGPLDGTVGMPVRPPLEPRRSGDE